LSARSFRDKKNDLEKLGRSAAELLPWIGFIDDETVICKDGGLLRCFEYNGFEHEGEEQYELDRQVRVLEQAFKSFDGHVAVWWTAVHLEGFEYPVVNIENETARILDRSWENQVNKSSNFLTRYFISIFYNPGRSIDSMAMRVAHYTEKGESTLMAMAKAFFSSVSHSKNMKEIMEIIHNTIESFDVMIESFIGTFRAVGFRPVKSEEMLELFHALSSPTDLVFPFDKVRYPDSAPFLDTFLCSDTIDFPGDKTIRFVNHDDVYGAAITIKDWVDYTYPGLLDWLMAFPVKMVVSQCFRFQEPEKAKKFAEGMSSHHNFRRISPIGYIKQAVLKEPGNESPMRVQMADEARSAVDEIDQGRSYGWYNMTIMVYDYDKKSLEESVRIVVNFLRDRGFISLRENLNLLGAWAATLPGQWFENVRWHFISSSNLADLAPIRVGSFGQKENKHLERQYERPFPALAVFPTVANRPYFFNLHQGDVGHTIVVGPTGAGKTVFVNFLISQWQKYAPCTTVIFDKDRSCRINTMMHGGRYMSFDGDLGVKLNPLAYLGNTDNWNWITSWIEILITARGYKMTSKDDEKIREALEAVSKMSNHWWTLSSFESFLSDMNLRAQLAPWVGHGQLARYFDHPEDEFDGTGFTAIDITRLFDVPRLAEAFMTYAFAKMGQDLGKNPGLVYLEEVWFLLADPTFSMQIADWLKTLRKKNTAVIMATQSLDDLARSKISSAIIDNVPTKIFLPNHNALAYKDMYRGVFDLNDAQIEAIRTAMPKTNYCIKTPDYFRVVHASFPDDILAVTRSDTRAQRALDDCMRDGSVNLRRYFDQLKRA
jgi:type IV secretion system protein VirB4